MDSSTLFSICGLTDKPCVLDLSQLFERFQALSDQRAARGKRYPLWVLLSIATLAKLAGQHTPQAIADWASLRTRALCRLFNLWRQQMPVLKTWNRVFAQALDPQQLEDQVCAFLRQSMAPSPRARDQYVVAIDGKTLRGTIRVGRSPGVHLLAIYQPEKGIVLAQAEIDSKANEISVAPVLLDQLDLHGFVLTGDAMFTQRDLSVQIVAAGGHYLWPVKDNQPRLLEAIETLFTPQPVTPGWGKLADDFTTASRTNKGNGRIEQRTLTASSMLQGYSDWPHLAQVFRLEYEAKNLVTGQVSHHVRYGVTSLPAELADAKRLLALARQHWGIESGLHYRRDVTLEEDKMRVCTGHAPHVHAILNNVVIAFLHRHSPRNIAYGQRQTSYHIERSLARLD